MPVVGRDKMVGPGVTNASCCGIAAENLSGVLGPPTTSIAGMDQGTIQFPLKTTVHFPATGGWRAGQVFSDAARTVAIEIGAIDTAAGTATVVVGPTVGDIGDERPNA